MLPHTRLGHQQHLANPTNLLVPRDKESDEEENNGIVQLLFAHDILSNQIEFLLQLLFLQHILHILARGILQLPRVFANVMLYKTIIPVKMCDLPK